MNVKLAITAYKCADGKYGATLVFSSFGGPSVEFRHVDLPCFVANSEELARTHALSEALKIAKEIYGEDCNLSTNYRSTSNNE